MSKDVKENVKPRTKRKKAKPKSKEEKEKTKQFCKVCGHVYYGNGNKSNHYEIHHSNMPYHCTIINCGQIYTSWPNLYLHLYKKHYDVISTNKFCTLMRIIDKVGQERRIEKCLAMLENQKECGIHCLNVHAKKGQTTKAE